MRSRTIRLLLGVSLSLIAGSTLRAQPPTPEQQRQIEKMLEAIEPQKFQFDPSNVPINPVIPPPRVEYRPPVWVEFLDRNPYLAAPLVAAAVTLVLAIFIGIPYRIVLGLIQVLSSRRGCDNGDGRPSRRVKRVSVVVLLLVIGLAAVFIVHAVVNGSR
jgi:hypothetical protein